MTVFDTTTTQIIKEIKFDTSMQGMMHPITYLNKFVFWSESQLYLYNVMEGSLVHKFKALPSDVVTVEQTPVVNIVACGLKSGAVVLFNLLYDEVLFTYSMKQGNIN